MEKIVFNKSITMGDVFEDETLTENEGEFLKLISRKMLVFREGQQERKK